MFSRQPAGAFRATPRAKCIARLGALLPLVLVTVLPAAAWAKADSVIVVNFGHHRSAEVAAGAEAKVNWLDADKTDDTVCTECFAAMELQRYLRKMTGRAGDFTIVDDDTTPTGELILVGPPASNAVSRRMASALGVDMEQLVQLGPEGYRIKTASVGGRRITLIAGGGRVGTLYGVYDLLHRMGCRWFAPSEVHEEVPNVEKLVEQLVEVDVTERPSFLGRGLYAWEDRGTPEFLLWMARNRLNEWCVEQSNHPLLHKLGIRMTGAMHNAEPDFINPCSAYPYDHPRFDADNENPKDPYPPSDQYQGDKNSDGKLSYFEAHPEWFALVEGKRIPGIIGEVGGTNFCTSNHDAVTEFLKNFVRAITDGVYRGTDAIRLQTLDIAGWCECEKCKSLGSPTDRYLLLVHRFDQEIKKARAEGRIHRPVAVRFMIYADVREPPTRPLPADFDYATCSGVFAVIFRCYVHNIDDPTCARNAHYQRLLHGWTTDPDRHYRGRLVLGEYYNVSRYKCLPICFMHTMANDIPYYHKVGARYFHYMHVNMVDWGSKALTNYQMARQLWDVDTDCEALWDDYFARRYGPAAGTMRQFYESLEKMFANVTPLRNWRGFVRRLDEGKEDFFQDSHLRYKRGPGVESRGPTLLEMVAHGKTCRELLRRAKAAELPERIEARIAEDDRLFTYGERTLLYYDACIRAFPFLRAEKIEDARRPYAEAKRLARLLEKDTISTSTAGCHASAPNAFVGTCAAGALERLAEILEPTEGKKPD